MHLFSVVVQTSSKISCHKVINKLITNLTKNKVFKNLKMHNSLQNITANEQNKSNETTLAKGNNYKTERIRRYSVMLKLIIK